MILMSVPFYRFPFLSKLCKEGDTETERNGEREKERLARRKM